MPLTKEHEEFRASVRSFLQREVGPERVRRMDDEDEFPEDVFERMAELGLLGVPFPEEFGGMGGDALHLLVLTEELGAMSGGLATVYGSTALFGGENILLSGSDVQRRDLLPRIVRGEVRTAMAVTEPGAGSDVAGLETEARPGPDGGWRISGRKVFISAAFEANLVFVVARTGRGERRHDGLSILLVPRSAEGLEVRKLRKLGHRGASVCELFLDGVEVPAEAVLGGAEAAGRGWEQVMATFDLERLVIAAESLGIARSAFEEALSYAKERRQFGRPIGKFQALSHLLADMATDLEACRAIIYGAADRMLAGLPCTKEAAMTKLFVTERAKEVCLAGMQVLGGYSYMLESDMQRRLRDVLLGPVGAGTSQIQRNVIARELGL